MVTTTTKTMQAGRAKLAVALLRRSTNMQDKSIAEQRDFIVAWARTNGYALVGEYVDDAISGDDHAHRAGFERLMRDLEKPGRVWGCILVYDRSRHTRADIFEAASYADRILKAGADVTYCVEGKSLSTEHEIVWAVETYQKHEVLKQTSRDTLRGMIALARKGFWCGGPVPYGYDAEIVDKASLKPVRRVRMIRRVRTLARGAGEAGDGVRRVPAVHHVLDLEGRFVREIQSGTESYSPLKTEGELTRLVLGERVRVDAVRDIFAAAVRGRGYKSIANELNGRAVPRPGGHGLWQLTAVKAILANPIYKGVFEWNSRTEAKYHSLVDGTMVARPRSEKARVVEHEESNRIRFDLPRVAIVSAELWARAQDRPKHWRPRLGRARDRQPLQIHSLLGGKLFCGDCGGKLYGTNSLKRKLVDGKVHEYWQRLYVCSTYLNSGIDHCGYNKLKREEIEEFVLACIRELVRGLVGPEPAVRERAREMLAGLLGGRRESAASAAQRLFELERQMGALEAVSPENRRILKLDETYERAKSEIARLRKRLTAADAAEEPDFDGQVDRVVGYSSQLDGFERLPVREQKGFVGELVERIDLTFGSVPYGKRQRRVLKSGVLRLRSPFETPRLRAAPQGGPPAGATLQNGSKSGSGGRI